MTRILGIETASHLCSVAIRDEGGVVSALSVARPRAHAELLPALIRNALEFAGLIAEDIAVVGVSAGPGSYTGLRIGVSAAKGFAFAVDAKLVAVDSLIARARAAASFLSAGPVLACALPSCRDEVYAGVYAVAGEGGLDELVPATAVSVSGFVGLLADVPAPDLLVGEGADRLAGLTDGASLRSGPRLVSGPVPGFDASWVARIAYERWSAGLTEDLYSFEPKYLKPFEARMPDAVFGEQRNSAG